MTPTGRWLKLARNLRNGSLCLLGFLIYAWPDVTLPVMRHIFTFALIITALTHLLDAGSHADNERRSGRTPDWKALHDKAGWEILTTLSLSLTGVMAGRLVSGTLHLP